LLSLAFSKKSDYLKKLEKAKKEDKVREKSLIEKIITEIIEPEFLNTRYSKPTKKYPIEFCLYDEELDDYYDEELDNYGVENLIEKAATEYRKVGWKVETERLGENKSYYTVIRIY
jgi:hypothetical protein